MHYRETILRYKRVGRHSIELWSITTQTRKKDAYSFVLLSRMRQIPFNFTRKEEGELMKLAIVIITLLVTVATAESKCNTTTFYGCSGKELQYYQSLQFNQRQQAQNSGFQALRAQQEARKYQSKVRAAAAQERGRKAAEKQRALARHESARKNNGRTSTLIQGSDGTWTQVETQRNKNRW